MDDLKIFHETANQYIKLDSKLYVSTQNVRNILDAAPIAIIIVRLSSNRIAYVNQKCCEVFRITREDSIGNVSASFWVNQADRDQYMCLFSEQGFTKDIEVKMRRHDGNEFMALISSTIVEYDGEKVSLSGVLDIQKRKNLEIKVSESEERFRTIVEKSPSPIVITRASDEIIIYLNPSALVIGSIAKESAIGRKAADFYVIPEDRRRLVEYVRRHGGVKNFETMITNNNGRVMNVLISATQTVYDEEEVLIFAMQDITHMKMMEQELRKLAAMDPLTNITNRRTFLERAELEFSRFTRYGQPCSLLFLDLDYFKKVNDQYGHQVGDEVLIDFTRRSQQCIRELDCIGRLGGEEFAMLLPETNVNQAEKVAAKIQEAIKTAYKTKQGVELLYTVSIGITQICKEDITIDQVLSRADRALYAAKKSGRNRFVTE